MKIREMTCLAILMLLLGGCSEPGGGRGNDSAADGRVIVTTTIAQIADMVEAIGGDQVQVTALCGPGVDPHLYKASQSDISQFSRSNVIFYNGLNLEGRMEDIFESMRTMGKTTVAVAESVDRSRLLEPEGYQGHYDPHIWMDVSLWVQTIPAVLETLANLKPEAREQFEQNAATYQKQLEQLHEEVREKIGSIPRERRVLITAHDAFAYFGKAYDIEVMGLQGISTTSEFGLQDLKRLTDIIVERGVKAVFIESSVPARSIEALVTGCRERGREISIGGELYSDAMGEPGTDEGTYAGMIRHNVNTIAQALK